MKINADRWERMCNFIFLHYPPTDEMFNDIQVNIGNKKFKFNSLVDYMTAIFLIENETKEDVSIYFNFTSSKFKDKMEIIHTNFINNILGKGD